MNAAIESRLARLQALVDELETRVAMLEDESEILIDAVAGEDE